MKTLMNQLKVAGVFERKGLQEVRDVGPSTDVPAASTQQASGTVEDVPQEVCHFGNTAISAEDAQGTSDASSIGQQ